MSPLTLLPSAAFALLLLAALLQAAFLLRREGRPAPARRLDPLSPFLLPAAAGLLLADLVRRSIQIRFVAITGIFESLVFFAAAVALALFSYRLRSGRRGLPFVLFGGTVTALLLMALASSPWPRGRWCLPSRPCNRTGWCCT